MSFAIVERIWYGSPVPVFLERFVLVLCAGAFWGFVMNDGMKLDIHYRIGLGIIIVGVAYTVAYAVYKHPKGEDKTRSDQFNTQATTGTLTAVTLFSANNDPYSAKFDVCDAGPLFVWDGPKGQPFFEVFGASNLVVERINGAVAVSTGVKDKFGKLIAEIRRNEWTVAPSLWDKNFNQDSLEIRDDSGDIVLQVTATVDFVRIRGKWRDANGQFFELTESPKKDGTFMTFRENQAIPIEPIFVYPSRTHLGELAIKNWKPNPKTGRVDLKIKETVRIPKNGQ